MKFNSNLRPPVASVEKMARTLCHQVDLGDEREVEHELIRICGFWPADVHEYLLAIIDRARALRAEAMIGEFA